MTHVGTIDPMRLKWARPAERDVWPHVDMADQHAAVVELMVLTVFAGKTLNIWSLGTLDLFDAHHHDWDQGAFSIQEYVGPATAKVRAALGRPGGQAELLKDASARITDPELRTATIGYCEDLVSGGGNEAEQDFLDRLRQSLADDSAP